MIGAVNVQVSSPRITYHLCLERNITVICDEGATGKSLLFSLVFDYRNVSSARATIKCTATHGLEIFALTQDLWNSDAYKRVTKPSIFIIDENAEFLRSRECQTWINQGLHYFIIMNRGQELRGLTFSVNSLKRLVGGRVKTLEPWKPSSGIPLTRKGNLWGTMDMSLPVQPNKLIVEDSNTGYQFFSHIVGSACEPCGTTVNGRLQGGKSEMLNCVRRLKQSRASDVLFIADGAAFGAELEYLWVQSLLVPGFHFYLYESFEWLLLHTPALYNNPKVRTCVDNPKVESSQFLSWERYFTKLLETYSRSLKGYEYTKSTLPSGYLQPSNVRALLACMPEISFDKWLGKVNMMTFEGYTYEFRSLDSCLALFEQNAAKLRCAKGYYMPSKTSAVVFYSPSERKIYYTRSELAGLNDFRGIRLTKEQVLTMLGGK